MLIAPPRPTHTTSPVALPVCRADTSSTASPAAAMGWSATRPRTIRSFSAPASSHSRRSASGYTRSTSRCAGRPPDESCGNTCAHRVEVKETTEGTTQALSISVCLRFPPLLPRRLALFMGCTIGWTGEDSRSLPVSRATACSAVAFGAIIPPQRVVFLVCFFPPGEKQTNCGPTSATQPP